ncbi:phosphatidylinositol mannoside acyltransferase [Corynebacterium bovis]|uniref:phosphatidylinositol mannoside acyltransferase n=1 Tax=Corynebacterium bovis TaxID=36808 RepID=UPI000F6328D5|nr:phosphatidylinositol mannoside acyltransferase [Corynebacterium bovis]RRO89507.1 phosphatidylinositol mannoside acyltransferase [Corynebacterium bovis]
MTSALTRDDLVALAYRAGWAVTARVPDGLASAAFAAGADRASHGGTGPAQLRANLARVVGPAAVTRDRVRDSMRSYMRYWKEAFQLPRIQGPELLRRLDRGFDPAELEVLRESREDGRGTVLVLPHSGNWDMAGLWLANNYGTFTTVAERLRPESLFDAFVAYRESLGFRIIALTGSEQPPFEAMVEVLENDGIVCLLGDRDLSGHGVLVSFFGERTSIPAGPALLAQRTGANLHVVHSYFDGPGWGFRVNRPTDTARPLAEVVQDTADQMAANIAANPADWHMLQPLWFDDLSDRRRLRAEGGTPDATSGSTGDGVSDR